MGLKTNAAAAFGAVTILYSASRAVFPAPLPPLAPIPKLPSRTPSSKPDLDRAVETFLKQEQGRRYVAPEQRETVFRSAVVGTVIASWAVVVVGLAAGALLLLRHRAGRWVAFGLYTAVLGATLLARVQLVTKAGWERSFRTWEMMARFAPRWVISTVLDLMLPTLALAYLAYGFFADRCGDARQRRPPPLS